MPTTSPVEADDVRPALLERHRGLGARDLLALAPRRRRSVRHMQTFDRALSAALDG